jgi:hypothetical protein
MGRDNKSIFMAIIITIIWLTAASAAQDNPKITYQNGLLSVTAQNVKTEALFTALGKQCAIEVVTHGNVFPEGEATISFENLPVKEGVKKLVKACGLKNYLIDFQGDAPESKKLAKIELFIGGSGSKVLNKAVEPQEKASTLVKTKISTAEEMQNLRESGKLQGKSSFREGHTMNYDGSALVEFPEFKGKLDYDKTQHGWNDEAKSFSHKSMSTVPPAFRDVVGQYLMNECDEIAKERNATVITQAMAAEALQRIGKNFNMPTSVMKNIPKNMEDLDKPRIPVDPNDLNPEYE